MSFTNFTTGSSHYSAAPTELSPNERLRYTDNVEDRISPAKCTSPSS
jgi:hypothetical protein